MARILDRPISKALLLAILVGACSSDGPTLPDEADTDQVAVRDNFFAPSTATLSPGTTVMWTWEGGAQYNVTWDEANLPSSETQISGSHQVTMPTEPGEYGYHCTIHGSPGVGMFGTIAVQ